MNTHFDYDLQRQALPLHKKIVLKNQRKGNDVRIKDLSSPDFVSADIAVEINHVGFFMECKADHYCKKQSGKWELSTKRMVLELVAAIDQSLVQPPFRISKMMSDGYDEHANLKQVVEKVMNRELDGRLGQVLRPSGYDHRLQYLYVGKEEDKTLTPVQAFRIKTKEMMLYFEETWASYPFTITATDRKNGQRPWYTISLLVDLDEILGAKPLKHVVTKLKI